MELLEDRVRYCCFNRYEKRQVEVPRSVVQSLLDSYGNLGNNPRREATHGARSRSKGWLKGLARQAEKYSRTTGRRLAGSLRQSICHRSKNRPFAIGDTLVVSGASWDSIDADTLKELVDRYQIRLVTTIADMIPILYPHHFQNQQTVDSFRRYAAVSASHASLVVSILDLDKSPAMRLVA